MGIMKWLARRGAVGGTARWAGKLYWRVKNSQGPQSTDEIMSALVEIRYSNNEAAKAALLDLIDSGEVHGLAHLVTNILSIEAGYAGNSPEQRFMFLDVIREELEKLGVPSKEIYDPSRFTL